MTDEIPQAAREEIEIFLDNLDKVIAEITCYPPVLDYIRTIALGRVNKLYGKNQDDMKETLLIILQQEYSRVNPQANVPEQEFWQSPECAEFLHEFADTIQLARLLTGQEMF